MELRDTSVRKGDAENVKAAKMKAPYAYIHAQFGYSAESIYRQPVCQSRLYVGAYPDTFPHNIREHFWIQEATLEQQAWISLGKLDNGLYFYYTAMSNRPDGRFFFKNAVTGFMNLWLSTSYAVLIERIMDPATYEKYISETVAAPAPVPLEALEDQQV
jgi:hypothetical protein